MSPDESGRITSRVLGTISNKKFNRMKRNYLRFILIFLWIFFLYQSVDAKESSRIYRRFKFDLSSGFAIPQDTPNPGFEFGILLAMEPKFALTDQLNLGLRLETTLMSQNIREHGGGFSGDPINMGGYLITLDYYLTLTDFRPFFGVGSGLSSIEIINDSNEYLTEDTFDLMFRTGFELKPIRMGIEYNINGHTKSFPWNNYLSLKAGLFFGGKRLK